MNTKGSLSEKEFINLEITNHARSAVIKTTEDPYFRDADPQLIMDALQNEIRSVSFGDYLKRLILKKQQADHAPDALDYTDYVCEAFRKRGVPPSFTQTTTKVRALAKNWLSQRTVNRNVVLLLGFALDLSPDEVNELLTKGLREPKLDPKDPFEVVCWYCYRYSLPYSRFDALWNHFSSPEQNWEKGPGLMLESTVRVRYKMESIGTEAQLTAYLSHLSLTRQTVGRQSVSARKQFDLLYRRTCELVARMKTEMEKDDAEMNAIRYAEELSGNDRMYDYEKIEKIGKKKGNYRVSRPEEISPADIENVIYSAVPKDRNGNLIPMKESLLNLQFFGKRLNRQHLTEILDGSGAINRFDLITLCFFTIAGETESDEEPKQRYDAFIRAVNQVLQDSDMSPLYVANPYESFVMMCMLADDPIGTYADVWELSYDNG